MAKAYSFTAHIVFTALLALTSPALQAQTPGPLLVGYWQNWNAAAAPYIPLTQVDPRYTVINVSFAVPKSGSSADMEFIPNQGSVSDFKTAVQTVRNSGKKVLISVGGANSPVVLNTTQERDLFISSMGTILSTYEFDGIDIDLEGASLILSGGTIANPTDAPIIHLIAALKILMSQYYSVYHRHMNLTFAPETAYIQGGMSAYGGVWGAYLPVIDALRDSLDLLHIQLYNSGSMYGIDGNIYTQGSADFIVAETEAVIQGFATAGGPFAGLVASKVAVGLPACDNAGGGFTNTATVAAAIKYLRGQGPRPGSYTLKTTGGYPDLRGMMTWSINWDATATCGSSYEYAANYQQLFDTKTTVFPLFADNEERLFYPNPAQRTLYIKGQAGRIKIYSALGQQLYEADANSEKGDYDISGLPAGSYFILCGNKSFPLAVIR